MPRRPPFAREHAWWSWHHPRIVRAVAGAAHEHWLAIVNRVLGVNRSTGSGPKSFDDLSQQVLIRRNARNVDRLLRGQYTASDGFRLALATALGIPVGDLLPDNRKWIARTTWRLCEGVVGDEDCRAYAAFREFAQHAESGSRTAHELNGTPADTCIAVEKAIAALDPILMVIDRELSAGD